MCKPRSTRTRQAPRAVPSPGHHLRRQGQPSQDVGTRRRGLLGHPACPPGAVRAAKAQTAGTSAWAARHVARSVSRAGSVTWSPEPGLPRCAAARLMLAQQRPHEPSVSLALADHKSCPPAILVWLSGADSSVAARLASSAVCPPAAMSGLACVHDSALRASVARNDRCPDVVVEALAADDDPMVREQAAANRSCPPGLLDRLCADEEASVRGRVAANPASRPEVLDRLASDLDAFVARDAVSNPSCPTGVLQRCVSDPRPEVHQEARSALESRSRSSRRGLRRRRI